MGMIVSWMLVASAVAAFSITALSGCVVIPALHRLHFGQTIRESGPTWHNKKQGTPTMGGLCFILGIVLALVLVLVGFRRYAPELMGTQQIQAVLLVMFLALGSGFIGFLDDFVKVVRHRNLGLVAWQKLVMQFAVTGGFLFGLNALGLLTTVITLPGGGALDLGLLYYPIAFFGMCPFWPRPRQVPARDSWSGTSILPRSLWAIPAACFWAASSRRWLLSCAVPSWFCSSASSISGTP